MRIFTIGYEATTMDEFIAVTTCMTTSRALSPTAWATSRFTSSTRYGASSRWRTRTSTAPGTPTTSFLICFAASIFVGPVAT